MNIVDIINNNRDKIANKLRECYRNVLESYGNIQQTVCLWDDGEFEILTEPSGSNGWLKPKEYEKRKLYCIARISQQYFDPWDLCLESKPDNIEKADEIEKEIIDEIINNYDAELIIDMALLEIIQQDESTTL